ncbi:THO complex subunit 5 homolog [Anopheles ziemanni]|uniref:THO complex subunit 5 homolog n=1 Tax=Anopheles coustani TaxID=139045 RepID=UPI002659F1DF|nr:THO complex subunit 5 homolog [Anopheles coustani]XP_058170269.1 THO complex subunit 5 homolog [Anopheles ziemanni]
MVSKLDVVEREVATDKKRRKTSVTNSAENVLATAKVNKEDVYMNTIACEEQESIGRSPAKDAQLFHNTCEELRILFGEIAKLKLESSEDSKGKMTEKRIEGSLAFVLLKKLNRLDKVRIRDGRDALHKEKLRVDSNRLQLQNLLYEAEHLKREVQRCYLFKSQDEEIELVPVEEFYERAPETVSRPDHTKTDEHIRRIARLEWELQQRKELDAQLKKLQTLKDAVQKDIVSKTERLESLGPRLRELLVATRPLQEALEMPIESGWEILKTVRLLSQPLYLLYANVSAYGEACDNLISATIQGDEEEAKQLENSLQDDDSLNHGCNDSGVCNFRDRGDSDNEENEHEQERGMKKRGHHRGQTKANLAEIRKERLFKVHPLSVTITVRTQDQSSMPSDTQTGPGLALTFSYLPNMNVVTVDCALTGIQISGVAAGDVLAVETILNELFPGDNGDESPNPKTKYQLQELSIETPLQMGKLLVESNLGRSFRWVQELCGLEFISSSYECRRDRYTGTKTTNANGCHETIPSIIRAIRNRWESRLKLYKQIHDLESKLIDTSTNDERGHSIRISSSLLQWSSISFEDYVASGVANGFVEDSVATDKDLYFRAIVIRGSAKLECYICVSCRYPEASPLWSLSLNWNGKHTAAGNSSVREMEYWVNTLSAKDHPHNVLPMQLKRAMSCLDVYLETDGQFYTPAEFTQDKTFLKPYRGRSRAKPFRIAPNGSSSLFTQI